MRSHPPDVEELVERYLDRELSSEEEREWEQHYFVCDECFRMLQHGWTMRDFLARRPLLGPSSERHLRWFERIRDSIRTLGEPRLAVLGGALAITTLVAVRGVVVERALERELASAGKARRIVAEERVATSRNGSTGLSVIELPAGADEGVLVSFALIEPAGGADAFSVDLVDPGGRILWQGRVQAEEVLTTLSLVMNRVDFPAGDYRLRVVEIRQADASVVDSYDLTFRVRHL